MGVILLAMAISAGIFQLSRIIILTRVWLKIDFVLQSATWDRLLHLPLSFFRQFSAGDLAQRSISIDTIHQILSETILDHVLNSFVILFTFILLFYYNFILAIGLVLFTLLFLSIYAVIFSRQL